MENNTVQNVAHGFKVFRPDWTCNPTGYNPKQYTCPRKFEEEGELDVCGHGMHFCQTAADCFNYYNFDSNNKVAEVIAYGEVLTEGDKSCTDKLEIVREIPWDEVLRIVNFGKNCTGYCNTGDYNTGDYNTGKCNAGNYNAGNRNTGSYNTGSRNAGDRNTGDYNVGRRNTGDYNAGDYNTGDYNVGRRNTGDYNAGDYNTGDYNVGRRNTGDFNIGRYNVGCFNTKEKKIMLFDKPSNMTFCEWMGSEARYLLNQMPKGVVEWVYEVDMTDEEKEQHPSYETTGGYLKVLDESECGQIWWGSLSDRQKNIIKAIPNFDAEIFFQCTGIRVDE